MKLVLFDIDGTLLRGQGQGRGALLSAMESVLPCDFPRANNIAGKTDLQFLHECLEDALAPHELQRWIPQVLERYMQILPERYTIDSGVFLLPGVRPLLDHLSARSDALVGVLTGNIAAGARHKLELFELADYFLLGAYGDEARFRRELPPIAVERARRIAGRNFAGKDIVIIGDTPNDIDCGRPVGARSLAVATGGDTAAELAEHEPDYLFESLADVDAVLAAVFAD